MTPLIAIKDLIPNWSNSPDTAIIADCRQWRPLMARMFSDRTEAGCALAGKLVDKNYDNPVVLALPRGGVPIAAEVAKALRAPMDIVLVRKIGTPGQPELALGAVVDGQPPQVVLNESVRRKSGVTDADIERAKQQQIAEINQRRALYLKDRERQPIEGKTAIVVDDGIATGATVRAALKALRLANPAKLVLAVPVAPADSLDILKAEVDDAICLETPEPFYAVGVYYRDFTPVSDQDVVSMLSKAKDAQGGGD
jgi:putative phosphoribosyl transferase